MVFTSYENWFRFQCPYVNINLTKNKVTTRIQLAYTRFLASK